MKHIAIHSAPRSGSTWLGSIFDSHPEVIYKLQPLFSYAFKDRITQNSTKFEINQFFEELQHTQDDFLDQTEGKKRGIIPVFSKTQPSAIVYKEVRYHHILKNYLFQDESIIIIGLIRNPLSVISSWLKAPKEFKKELGWKIKEEWRSAPNKNLDKIEEYNGYEKWKEVAKLFLELNQNYPKRFYLVNYEDLLDNPFKCVKDIFRFCHLKYPNQTEDFLLKSTQNNDDDPYSVFKSKKKDDKWKNDLPNYIIEEIKNDPEFVSLNVIFKWI